MTVHDKKVDIVDGQLTITGRVGDSMVTYTGAVGKMTFLIDDHIDREKMSDYIFDLDVRSIRPIQYSVLIDFAEEDGKQVSVKTTPVRHSVTRTARVEKQNGDNADTLAKKVGAPAAHTLRSEGSYYYFEWTEEV